MKQINWKPGDIAICVNSGKLPTSIPDFEGPPLRKKSEYIVNQVRTCECGVVSLDVGLFCNTGVTCKCGAKSSPVSGVWWCNAVRFVKKETAVETEKQVEYTSLEDALKAEDYLAAAKIRDNNS